MNDKQPTSGFVSDIGDESDFNSTRHNGGFTNISEAYVSKSGFTRMFSAVRYGKRYMLKCLKPDFAYTPTYRQALMKEFEIGLQLDHPNICRTISMEPVGELGDCIVMEYVDGETLEAAVKGGNMTEEKARKTASQLLDAMEYMHAKQTVHRDLKPSNIMLTHRGGDVKIIDFGLSDSETFCVLKIPAGTRGYMAPEQLKPGAQSDPSADIYSFGKVLEYMAEAAPPLQESCKGGAEVCRCRPCPPSCRHSTGKAIDNRQGWVVSRCECCSRGIGIGAARRCRRDDELTPDRSNKHAAHRLSFRWSDQ